MNREQYIDELKIALKTLPQEEVDNAVEYVEEYFAEAGEENFNQALKDLGNPEKFAVQTKADYQIRQNEENKNTNKKVDLKSIWTVSLGILTLPLSLSALLVAVILLLTVYLCGFIFLLTGGMLTVGFLLIGVALLRIMVLVIINDVGAGLIVLASILLIGALECLSLAGTIAMYKQMLPWINNKVGKIYSRLKGDKAYE